MTRVLFVCLGNICRSPLVEQVAREQLATARLEVSVASCGTGNWHVGETADTRMIAAARAAGHDLAAHRARQLRADDWQQFDLLLAMDHDNLAHLRHHAPSTALAAKAALFLPWSGIASPEAFPDPWHGDAAAFADAVALAERAVPGLVARLRRG